MLLAAFASSSQLKSGMLRNYSLIRELAYQAILGAQQPIILELLRDIFLGPRVPTFQASYVYHQV